MTKGYVWYSFGSDQSGQKLAKALGFEAGSKTPTPGLYSVIIGWGAKPGTKYSQPEVKKAIATGKLRLLNPVELIVENRDKMKTLLKLEAAGVMTPGLVTRSTLTTAQFVEKVKKALQEGRVSFPLMGLTATNKGAPHFFYTVEDLSRGPEAVEYVRSFSPGTEYRVHVMRNLVLLAQKKQLAKDPVQACVTDLDARLEATVEKKPGLGPILAHMRANSALRFIVEELAGELFASPNQIMRSVNQGWELVDVASKDVPEKVKAEAIRALEAAGLDLGAVSVTLDEGDPHAKAVVTVITTGPSLTPAHLNAYVQVLKDFSAGPPVKEEVAAVKKSVADIDRSAPAELQNRLVKKIASLSEKEARRVMAYLDAE